MRSSLRKARAQAPTRPTIGSAKNIRRAKLAVIPTPVSDPLLSERQLSLPSEYLLASSERYIIFICVFLSTCSLAGEKRFLLRCIYPRTRSGPARLPSAGLLGRSALFLIVYCCFWVGRRGIGGRRCLSCSNVLSTIIYRERGCERCGGPGLLPLFSGLEKEERRTLLSGRNVFLATPRQARRRHKRGGLGRQRTTGQARMSCGFLQYLIGVYRPRREYRDLGAY